jgi:murein L,D-transpeptidase YcbB/YkuD
MTGDAKPRGGAGPARGLLLGLVAAALLAGGVEARPRAQGPADALAQSLKSLDKSDREIRAFYEQRGHRPLWVRGGRVGFEADRLLDLIATADLDGLDPEQFRPRALASTIRKARGGSPKALAAAEVMLSRTFASYVRAVRTPRDVGMAYVDQAAVPVVPTRTAVLAAAASAPLLADYLDEAPWMHPLYNRLREALHADRGDGPSAQLLWLNLERARILPASTSGRHVLVDVASQRLFLYDGGVLQDTMRVVVGKPEQQTPMIAGMIRYATLNPYWNIPPDLVQTQVAGGVLSKGVSYLKSKRYQLLSDWSESPKVLSPAKIDWRAVAAGRQELRVRQLPGKGNAMGKMKFMFPNDLGIYLHDTPERALLLKPVRTFSSGCVRLEDAPRLARWLFGKPLTAPSAKPEQHVSLPDPVPIYITYLTASPDGERIAFRPDVYRRDRVQMARLAARD